MGGIAGIWSQREGHRPDQITAQVQAMLEAMIHRGPDQGAIASSSIGASSIVVGARRLAIQDLSAAGSQPMIDPATGNIIAFDGEIYNFRELRREIKADGVVSSESDTEVVLRAYGALGADVVHRLRGMFAFALWDRKLGALFLARDRLGVKPLYYHRSAESFAFASEVRALLRGSVAAPNLNPMAIRSYLGFGAVSEPLTIVEGVREFPPGVCGYVGTSSFKLTQYWSLDEAFQAADPPKSSDELASHLHQLLTDSVKVRLVSDAPVGIFLSGGLDSTVIAMLAAEQSPAPIHSVSVVFPARDLSEKVWIDKTVSHVGSIHSEVVVPDSDLLPLITTALAAYDQPSMGALNTFIVCNSARQTGLTVALSGIGADELFGGYPAFRQLPRLRAIRRSVPDFALRPAVEVYSRLARHDDRAKKLADYFVPLAGNALAGELMHRGLFTAEDRRKLTAAWPGSPLSDIADVVWIPPELDWFNALSYSETSGYLRNMLLRDTDFASMASSLEIREPYLDHELVAAVVSLPGSVKGGSQTKPFLRRIARRIVPEGLLRPGKRSFALPMNRWIRGELRSEVRDVLMDRTVSYQLSQIISDEAVENVWYSFADGKTGWTRPWSLYVLKSWARMWAN